jgi:hypothetical protein
MSRVEYLPVIAPPISYTWKPSDGENIITVARNVKSDVISLYPSLGSEIAVNGYLTELRATATLNSIDLARPLTTSPDTNTDAEIQADVLETTWNSARVHLAIWTSNKENPTSNSDWDNHGFVSMQNSQYYPYEFHDMKRILSQNLAYEIGAPGRIGLSVVSVMFNNEILMLNADDRLTFRGSFRQEVHSVQPDAVPVYVLNQGTVQSIQQRFEQKRLTVGASNRQTIMDSRTSRINGLITNLAASSGLYVKEGGLVSATDYTYIVTAGASRSITAGYSGVVTALSVSGTVQIETQETYNVPVTQ